jgi:hypothetical protein
LDPSTVCDLLRLKRLRNRRDFLVGCLGEFVKGIGGDVRLPESCWKQYCRCFIRSRSSNFRDAQVVGDCDVAYGLATDHVDSVVEQIAKDEKLRRLLASKGM